jgi:hypothetical protein
MSRLPHEIHRESWKIFYQLYKECYRDLKTGNKKSNVAEHLLDNNHSMGPIMDIMSVLHIINKAEHMNSLEKFHIYVETKTNSQIDDKYTGINYSLSDVVISNVIQ